MKRTFDEARRAAGIRLALTCAPCALFAAVGCSSGHDAGGQGIESSLAALMEDGPLPDGMTPPGGMGPSLPPRFCGGEPPFPFPPMEPGEPGVRDAGIDEEPPTAPPRTPPIFGGADMNIGMAGAGAFPGEPMLPGDPGMAVDAGFPFPDDGGVPFPDDEGDCSTVPIGFWRFDDCSAERTDLRDSSFQDHTAYRTVDLVCAPSQEGQGVTFQKKGDLVYAPDQPDFGLQAGVTVAAWVKPDKVTGTQTIFRKRDDRNSAFALLIHRRSYTFVVRLDNGRLASVRARAKAGEWTHVAATYDGLYLKLYLNGEMVDSDTAAGALANGVGPLLMGNDASERRLDGMMDNAWFNTLAAPESTILELLCLRASPTLSVEPEVGPAVQAGTPVIYQLSIKNNHTATCAPAQFLAFVSAPNEFSVNPSFVFTQPLASGETAQLPIEVASGEEAEPDSYPVDFFVGSFDEGEFTNLQAQYVVAEPTGCFVRSSRELTIRDISVVDDPLRTSMNGPVEDPRTGAWSFGRLMEHLSPTPEDAPEVTEAMFRTFLSPQSVNGFLVEARPAMDPLVLAPWPRTSDGRLDLARAPLRLLAIVNRLDLKDLANGKAGEGRMVYGMLDEFGFPLEFTVILEYLLPANDEADFIDWAEAFHALKELPFPSEEYNAALQALTDRFAGRGVAPGMDNGSALIDIRTNEIALSFQWQLREFHISPETGGMEPAGLFQTPDASFNFGDRLGRFINANEAEILTERHDVPLSFEGAPFQAGAVFNNIDFWFAPGVTNPEARHKFSLNTCNGCHGAETGTEFLMIFPRFEGEQSSLSGFQTGITVFDPVTGEPRRLAELFRRRQLLEAVVCAEEP